MESHAFNFKVLSSSSDSDDTTVYDFKHMLLQCGLDVSAAIFISTIFILFAVAVILLITFIHIFGGQIGALPPEMWSELSPEIPWRYFTYWILWICKGF